MLRTHEQLSVRRQNGKRLRPIRGFVYHDAFQTVYLVMEQAPAMETPVPVDNCQHGFLFDANSYGEQPCCESQHLGLFARVLVIQAVYSNRFP